MLVSQRSANDLVLALLQPINALLKSSPLLSPFQHLNAIFGEDLLNELQMHYRGRMEEMIGQENIKGGGF